MSGFESPSATAGRGSAAAADTAVAEENVDFLQFGKDFNNVEFLPNSFTALLLSTIRERDPDKRVPEAYLKAQEYATRFSGAVSTKDVAAIDELLSSLRNMEFMRTLDDGSTETLRLHEYQLTALSNLNPDKVEAARALIPGLEKFADDEVEEVLAILRRASARLGE